MGSLSELLSQISTLPRSELEPGTQEAERPNEMALLHEVIPAIQVKRLRECGIDFKRYCSKRWGKAEMGFRIIRNNITHQVIASYGSATGVEVRHITNFRSAKVVPISSVQELHEYILSVVAKETANTT